MPDVLIRGDRVDLVKTADLHGCQWKTPRLHILMATRLNRQRGLGHTQEGQATGSTVNEGILAGF